MEKQIYCPHCGKSQDSKADDNSDTYECPQCQKRFIIEKSPFGPAPGPAPAAVPDAMPNPAPIPPPSGQPAPNVVALKEPSEKKQKAVGIAVCVVTCLLVLCFLLLHAWSAAPTPTRTSVSPDPVTETFTAGYISYEIPQSWGLTVNKEGQYHFPQSGLQNGFLVVTHFDNSEFYEDFDYDIPFIKLAPTLLMRDGYEILSKEEMELDGFPAVLMTYENDDSPSDMESTVIFIEADTHLHMIAYTCFKDSRGYPMRSQIDSIIESIKVDTTQAISGPDFTDPDFTVDYVHADYELLTGPDAEEYGFVRITYEGYVESSDIIERKSTGFTGLSYRIITEDGDWMLLFSENFADFEKMESMNLIGRNITVYATYMFNYDEFSMPTSVLMSTDRVVDMDTGEVFYLEDFN